MNKMAEKGQREAAYHEAGHAVVAWSLGLPVEAVRIGYSKEKGWYGGAEIGTAEHLSLSDQIAVCLAGVETEEVFQYESHENASFSDNWKVHELIEANGISDEDQDRALRDEGGSRARTIIETHRSKVDRLVERLVESGSVDASEFLRLIDDKAR
jgi:ATP-dependent Zn protease